MPKVNPRRTEIGIRPISRPGGDQDPVQFAVLAVWPGSVMDLHFRSEMLQHPLRLRSSFEVSHGMPIPSPTHLGEGEAAGIFRIGNQSRLRQKGARLFKGEGHNWRFETETVNLNI